MRTREKKPINKLTIINKERSKFTFSWNLNYYEWFTLSYKKVIYGEKCDIFDINNPQIKRRNINDAIRGVVGMNENCFGWV